MSLHPPTWRGTCAGSGSGGGNIGVGAERPFRPKLHRRGNPNGGLPLLAHGKALAYVLVYICVRVCVGIVDRVRRWKELGNRSKIICFIVLYFSFF